MVLAALLQLHFGAPNEFIKTYLDDNELLSELTESEMQKLEKTYENWEEQDKTNLYWSIEAIWTFAWIGEKHSNLTFNTGVEETLASYLPNFQTNEPAKEFIENFTIRPEVEIVTMLDLFYRAHWFAKNISIKGQESSMVDLDIIMERRKALEWVCNIEESWDDITLDT